MPGSGPEYPPGMYPIHRDDDLVTIMTGFLAGRIQMAENIGIMPEGSAEQYLTELDSSITEEDKRAVARKWSQAHCECQKADLERNVTATVERMRRILEDNGNG